MKILVIGERCIDEFIYCEVVKISPEAPVPVLKPLRNETYYGMACNVMKNVMDISDILSVHLEQKDVNLLYQHEEIVKTRYIDEKSNQQFFRVDLENGCSLMDWEKCKSYVTNADIVIVSDYNKGLFNNKLLKKIGENSKFSVLDTKRKINKKVLKAFSFVKMNDNEAKLNSKLIEKSNLIITAGSKGAYCGEFHYPTEAKETLDVTGAGDTFTAAFALNYYLTENLDKSIEFANEMAGIVVTKRGIQTPK